MLEKDIVNKCIQIIKKYSPIKTISTKEINTYQNKRTDAFLNVTTDSGLVQFVVEVKRILKRPLPLNLFFENISEDKIPLIMAEYVNSSIADELIRKQVNFVDCQGNIFINIPGKIYIDVKGNKPEKQKEKQPTILFNPKGMQLLTILLNDESLLNNSLRSLQNMAGISLERTSKVMHELKENGYIWQTKKNNFKFRNKKVIFERWLENYGERLRPKLLLGTYRISPTMWQQTADILKINNFKSVFTGGFGAEMLTQYYQAKIMDIFITENEVAKVKNKLRLLPAEDYNLRLFNLFSDEIIFKYNGENIAHPLLIYAELIYQGGDRELETAEIIYNRYLKDLF
ncbi:MAG: hypothetical protein KAU01_11305 [Candidatus Cloacimonetes bacterium]|nr:hypothetical protein [Candidatus Cloacimonadota bacterium]